MLIKNIYNNCANDEKLEQNITIFFPFQKFNFKTWLRYKVFKIIVI